MRGAGLDGEELAWGGGEDLAWGGGEDLAWGWGQVIALFSSIARRLLGPDRWSTSSIANSSLLAGAWFAEEKTRR